MFVCCSFSTEEASSRNENFPRWTVYLYVPYPVQPHGIVTNRCIISLTILYDITGVEYESALVKKVRATFVCIYVIYIYNYTSLDVVDFRLQKHHYM